MRLFSISNAAAGQRQEFKRDAITFHSLKAQKTSLPLTWPSLPATSDYVLEMDCRQPPGAVLSLLIPDDFLPITNIESMFGRCL